MAVFIAGLLLLLSTILQNTIVNHVNLLVGAADLVLLVLISWILQADDTNPIKYGLIAGLLIGISSAVPVWVSVLGYGAVAGLIMLLNVRIWQAPYWMLLTSTFLGTVIVSGTEILVLWALGYPYDLYEMVELVILPSIVLNVIFVLPVYFFVGEITKFVYPKEVQV
jgi:rod shape-determining protein MreD